MKNWMIRTKNNHILGPVTREKIRDLIENGSIKQDDEICSGNGYWIFVREQALVNKYIFSDHKQSFNPISEAKSFLTESNDQMDNIANQVAINDSSTKMTDHLPSDDDLEYPDLTDNILSDEKSNNSAKSEMLSKVTELKSHKKFEENDKILEHEKKMRPQKENIELKPPVHASDLAKSRIQAPEIPATISKNSLLTFNMLVSLVITFLLMMALALYFRGYLIDFFRGASNISVFGIESIYAQSSDQFVQKKKF
jgi:hypothetical protein